METLPLSSVQNGRSILGERDEELAGLFEISHALLSPNGLESALTGVVLCLAQRFGFQGPLVATCGTDAPPRVVASADANRPESYRAAALSVVDRVVKTSSTVPVHDGHSNRACDECDPAHQDRLCHFVGVPILRRDEVVGAIVAERSEAIHGDGSMARDLRILEMVAKLVGQTFLFQDLVARDRQRLMEERRTAEKCFKAPEGGAERPAARGIVGESPVIQAVLRKVHIVAKSPLPVLLRGESGTGKELFAQAIHELSPRRGGPMIKLNCAALPETMLESELFGHEKGAFTGAVVQRKGRFELADGGTLFLDEIGEISAGFQAKLLRVLQEGEFERVGGSETIKVDVRLVAATNRDLEKAVREETFRSDLYFRLCVVPIVLAPLRERPEDIPMLAEEFLRRYNDASGSALQFSDDAVSLMRSCAFPGNIRELESCVRRTAAFAEGEVIHAGDFACRNDSCLSSLLAVRRPAHGASEGFKPLPILALHKPEPEAEADIDSSFSGSDSVFDDDPGEISTEDTPERRRLVDAMERAGWVQAKAARLLGLTPRQICYALRKHGVEVKKF